MKNVVLVNFGDKLNICKIGALLKFVFLSQILRGKFLKYSQKGYCNKF